MILFYSNKNYFLKKIHQTKYVLVYVLILVPGSGLSHVYNSTFYRLLHLEVEQVGHIFGNDMCNRGANNTVLFNLYERFGSYVASVSSVSIQLSTLNLNKIVKFRKLNNTICIKRIIGCLIVIIKSLIFTEM